jgi:hypothetical protein
VRPLVDRLDSQVPRREGKRNSLIAFFGFGLPMFAFIVYRYTIPFSKLTNRRNWGLDPVKDHWMNHMAEDADYYEKKFLEKMEEVRLQREKLKEQESNKK